MSDFKFALNASTLFPFELDVIEQIQIAGQAGYDGIELWVKDIESYLENGGSIRTLKDCLDDSSISVVNAITFFKWSDVDDNTRRNGLDQAEREMLLLKDLGCPAVAAPPSGNVEGVSLETMAFHFAELLNIARNIGIEPYLEFWGKSTKLSTLSEAMYVAMESRLPNVKILLDPFHIYTGGSSFDSLHYLRCKNIGIVHVNDYPAFPTREHIADRDRVFPGDGIAPTKEITNYLKDIGYSGYLSLELFMEDVGSQTPLTVASQGLHKIKKAYGVEK